MQKRLVWNSAETHDFGAPILPQPANSPHIREDMGHDSVPPHVAEVFGDRFSTGRHVELPIRAG